MQRAGVILLDPISFIVLFLDNSDTSRCHVKTIHLVLLHSVPNNPRVWSHWLSFKEHALGSSDEGSIYYEAMADHPTNITSGEVNSAFLDIEDMCHAEIQSNSCTACLSCDSFWLASGARSVKNVEGMGGWDWDGCCGFCAGSHQGVVVEVLGWIDLLQKFSIEFFSLLD